MSVFHVQGSTISKNQKIQCAHQIWREKIATQIKQNDT